MERFKLIPYLARKDEIESLLKILESSDKDVQIYTSADSTRHVRVLNALVKSAIQAKVSDILFELKEGQLEIFFRNGEQLSRVSQPVDGAREFFDKLKEICGFRGDDKQPARESWLNLSKNFSHLKIKVLYYSSGSQENIRLPLPQPAGVRQEDRRTQPGGRRGGPLRSILQKPSGLFVVAGPTHNQTPETMYALMNTLAGERIATVEGDVVLRNERFFQIENQGGDVSDAVYKNLLFFKPDSMFLFDFLQKSYNRQFLNFVEMGKLFIEVQGFSYEEVFEKMQVEYEVPPSFLVENLRLVIFQRQVKTLCGACKKPNPRLGPGAFQEQETERRLPGFPGGRLPGMPVRRLRRR